MSDRQFVVWMWSAGSVTRGVNRVSGSEWSWMDLCPAKGLRGAGYAGDSAPATAKSYRVDVGRAMGDGGLLSHPGW